MAWSLERIRSALKIVAVFEQQKIAFYDLYNNWSNCEGSEKREVRRRG